MKVAVTGAAGFVGLNLIDRLVTEGHEVVAIDRVRSERLPAGVEQVMGDVLDPQSMTRALDGAEIVYHLVAMITLDQENALAWQINTEGVRTVAEAAREVGVRRFVHCSSVHSFDQYTCGGRLDETSARSEGSSVPVYDRSKWAGEIELRKVIDAGLDAVVCNPTGIYGPVDYGLSRLNGLLRDAASGRVPAAIEGGFDFVDVRDVAAGLMAAADRGRTGENYLLTGEMVTILDVMRTAARAAGRRGPLFAFPLSIINVIMPVAEKIGAALGSDVMSRAAMGSLLAAPVVDGSKARAELGYSSRPVADSVRDLVGFLVTSGQLATR